jgi:uncharacterized glyoxalase superfamily protein PhnB
MRLASMVPMVFVSDVAKSTEFYQMALGFKVLNTYEWQGQLNWVFLQADAVNLMLLAAEEPFGERQSRDLILYFYPDDIEALYADLVQKGFAVSELSVSFYSMKEFRLEDPDGYELCFGQAVRSEP